MKVITFSKKVTVLTTHWEHKVEISANPGERLVFDDDNYYMGGVLAEKLRREQHEVTLATPAAEVSSWTRMTDEQPKVQAQLIRLGVELLPSHALAGGESFPGSFAAGRNHLPACRSAACARRCRGGVAMLPRHPPGGRRTGGG